MNTNMSRWAVEVGHENLSEAVQTIAFSYGYSWFSWGDKTIGNTTAKFLIFNPETKAITYADFWYELEDTCNQVVTTFDGVMKLFKNPPTVDLVIGNFTITKSGDVTVCKGATRSVIPSEDFDKVVNERAKFLKREDPTPLKQKLPVVQFTYTSQNSGRRLRNVIVTDMTDELISGLDKDADNRFKKFLMSKVSGTVRFVGFVDA